jgi:hypothetical protein
VSGVMAASVISSQVDDLLGLLGRRSNLLGIIVRVSVVTLALRKESGRTGSITGGTRLLLDGGAACNTARSPLCLGLLALQRRKETAETYTQSLDLAAHLFSVSLSALKLQCDIWWRRRTALDKTEVLKSFFCIFSFD